MSDIDPFSRFPEMRPVQTAPSLGLLNGIGVTLYGSRDADAETGTHVKTYCFCLLFIPVLALGAYRVADAPGGGWYFVGKVPLSPFARIWNFLFAFLVFAGIGFASWTTYTGSAEYKAGQKIARADQLLSEGQAKQAADLYREVMIGSTDRSATARKKLTEMIATPPEDPAQTAEVLRLGLDLHRQGLLNLPDLQQQGSALVAKYEKDNPRGALAILEVIEPLAEKPGQYLPIKGRILERLVAESPDDPKLASSLAVVYEAKGDSAKCEALLLPHEKRLGDLDGAAVLGRIHAAKGRLDPALALLDGYLQVRLPLLREAEKTYTDALTNARQAAIFELQQGRAVGLDLNRLNQMNKDEQMTAIGEYVANRLRDNPTFQKAQQDLMAQKAVVPAALDLGMVRLMLAQKLVDPESRKDMLRKAEEAFLGVRALAGESDKYRLQLGQVYYWLGRHTEGKKLFDDLLAQHMREADVLMAVGRILREVGSTSEARTLFEEAWKTGAKDRKPDAAILRSLVAEDLDDKILWLERSDPSQPETRTTLEQTRGLKAIQDGKDEEAIKHFRAALAIYAKMPENAATLNNAALVHLSLYPLTQEREQLQRGIDNLDRAIALQPGDSIVLLNAASNVQDTTYRDIVGNRIDFKVLKRNGGSDLLGYLYADAAGKKPIIQELLKHPGFAKVKGYCDKMMLLAPRRPDGYSMLSGLLSNARDLAGMKALLDRLEKVKLDLEDHKKEMLEFFAGKKDDKRREDIRKGLERQQKILAEARKVGGITFAVAAYRYQTLLLSQTLDGTEIDTDALVRIAEEADKAAPSSVTRTGRIEAPFRRAHQRLMKKDDEYATAARKAARSLGHTVLVWAVTRPGGMRERILADEDIKKAIELKREQTKAFPDEPDAFSVTMIEAAGAPEAAEAKKVLLADAWRPVRAAVDRQLSPLVGMLILEEYLILRLQGKNDEADAELAKAGKLGVPLP